MPINADMAAVSVTVVDDEPLVRNVLVFATQSLQCSCQSADSAEAAVELLERRPTPLVITDLRMPGRGGVWLVHEIHRRWPETGIIVVTGSNDSDAARECLNAGADRYLLKPINLEELRHALFTTWHTVQLERERERYRQELELKVHRQMGRIRNTFLSAIDSLVRTLEARHPYTKGHSLRVRRYGLRLARVLRLDQRQCRQLSLAAKLHDIGKVGTPEGILNKPGQLTPAELEVIQEHPVIGERILSPIIRDPVVLAAIRSHHERLDGKGYPDGLRGTQLPLLARVIAVVDCFDALTSSRAYRNTLRPTQALAVLRAGAGTRFEPDFVDAFLSLFPPTPHVAPPLSEPQFNLEDRLTVY
jgi:putative nucleotidyltransferase with HDIG domain